MLSPQTASCTDKNKTCFTSAGKRNTRVLERSYGPPLLKENKSVCYTRNPPTPPPPNPQKPRPPRTPPKQTQWVRVSLGIFHLQPVHPDTQAPPGEPLTISSCQWAASLSLHPKFQAGPLQTHTLSYTHTHMKSEHSSLLLLHPPPTAPPVASTAGRTLPWKHLPLLSGEYLGSLVTSFLGWVAFFLFAPWCIFSYPHPPQSTNFQI